MRTPLSPWKERWALCTMRGFLFGSRLFVILFGTVAASIPFQGWGQTSTNGIEGIWLGKFDPPYNIRLVFKISRQPDGTLAATLDSPDRGRKDVPVNQITFQGNRLHLEVEKISSVFNGTLTANGMELKGQWRQESINITAPITLKRTDQAPEIPKAGAGVWIAAVVATVLSLLVIGGAIRALTPRDHRRRLLIVIGLHLPMCALAYYVIRLPLDSLMKAVIDIRSELYGLTTLLYAPLTEEPAKLWLLIFPWFRLMLTRQSALWLGMAVGLGFGLGEMWLLAHWLSHDPQIASLPWYSLSGYIGERFLVCINHGVFTTIALRTVRSTPVRSVGFAMLLHLIGNAPIYLTKSLGHDQRQTILALWGLLFPVAMVGLLVRLYNLDLRHLLLGRASCPECGLVYERRWMAVNMGSRRYELCPGCKKWHWTETLKEDASGQMVSQNSEKS